MYNSCFPHRWARSAFVQECPRLVGESPQQSLDSPVYRKGVLPEIERYASMKILRLTISNSDLFPHSHGFGYSRSGHPLRSRRSLGEVTCFNMCWQCSYCESKFGRMIEQRGPLCPKVIQYTRSLSHILCHFIERWICIGKISSISRSGRSKERFSNLPTDKNSKLTRIEVRAAVKWP